MKNQTFILSILFLAVVSTLCYAFISNHKSAAPAATSQYMIVTVLETSSAFDGKMIVTAADGTSNTTDLKNYYGGFAAPKNTASNDKIILDELNLLHNQGWDIDKTIGSALSSSTGLSITRYILKKS